MIQTCSIIFQNSWRMTYSASAEMREKGHAPTRENFIYHVYSYIYTFNYITMYAFEQCMFMHCSFRYKKLPMWILCFFYSCKIKKQPEISATRKITFAYISSSVCDIMKHNVTCSDSKHKYKHLQAANSWTFKPKLGGYNAWVLLVWEGSTLRFNYLKLTGSLWWSSGGTFWVPSGACSELTAGMPRSDFWTCWNCSSGCPSCSQRCCWSPWTWRCRGGRSRTVGSNSTATLRWPSSSRCCPGRRWWDWGQSWGRRGRCRCRQHTRGHTGETHRRSPPAATGRAAPSRWWRPQQWWSLFSAEPRGAGGYAADTAVHSCARGSR